MDPDERLNNIRFLARKVLVEEDYSIGTAKMLAAAVANLDTWLGRGGFPPDAWTKNRPEPQIELFHDRDYDGGCDIRVYVDGEEAGFTGYSFDPGYGNVFSEYAPSLAWDVARASEKLQPLVYEAAWAALTDRYTEGQPDDERVARRYFDLLILDEERKLGDERTGTGTALHPAACEGVAH